MLQLKTAEFRKELLLEKCIVLNTYQKKNDLLEVRKRIKCKPFSNHTHYALIYINSNLKTTLKVISYKCSDHLSLRAQTMCPLQGKKCT